jgi:hypothetical protein
MEAQRDEDQHNVVRHQSKAMARVAGEEPPIGIRNLVGLLQEE